RSGLGDVDALHACVRVRAADDGHVHRRGQRQVVDERPPPAQEGRVLLALDGRADKSGCGLDGGHEDTPAAEATASTMLWYPVQRQRLPSRPSLIACSSVAAPLSIRLTAASTMPEVQ